MLLALVVCLSSCSSDPQPVPRSPDGTTPDGTWLMVTNDCEGDCDEPGIGMGGRFYYPISCEPVDAESVGERVAVADPASVITVRYQEARPIVGIPVEQAVAVGPESPTACDSRDMVGWFAVRSEEYLYSTVLDQLLRNVSSGR